MSRLLLLFCAALIVAFALPAYASIGMVVGMQTTDSCQLASDSGLITVSVVHWVYPQNGARGARYRLTLCNSTLVFLVSTSPYTISGDFNSGYVVDYGSCLGANGASVIQTLSFFGVGTSTFDSAIKVVQHPVAASGQVEGINCDGTVTIVEGDGICIKPHGACSCNLLGPPYAIIPCQSPVASEPSTWGQVKSLYR